jgi:hypothetical protein
MGASALVAGCIGGWFAPAAALPAARFAAVCCFQPALGCLIFSLVHRVTGGQWGDPLRIPFAAGVRLVPWIWPVLATIALSPYARPDLPLPHGAAPLPTAGVLALRAVCFEVMLIVLTLFAVRPRLRRFAAPALLLLVFGGHFLIADLFFTLEPGWYSTGFPLVWLAVCAASGFALALLAAVAAGHSPSAAGAAHRAVGLDWGNLLLTAVVFSTYLVLMEFLVIWSANLAPEISWYLRRGQGLWAVITGAIVAFHLGFPFLLLLSHRGKEGSRVVPIAAAMVAASGILWAVWLVLPPFADRGAAVAPFAALFLAGGLGVAANRYVANFRREEAP